MNERKESPVGRIPVEWDVVKLSNIANIDSTSLNSTTKPDFNFFYIDITAVKTGRIDKPTTKISFKNSPSRARRILQSDDVLMSTVRPNLKSFAYFDGSSGDYICSTGFSVLRSKNNNGKFIFHNLFSESITNQIDALVVGSNYPAINSSDVKNLLIPNPPLPEQKKIAKILTSVDEVIETTETQINKLKDLKKGMMNDLLTKGIGHTEFKDSPVGRIPVGWEVKFLQDVSVNHDSKRIPIKSSERTDRQGKYPYYGASGIIDYVDDYIFDGEYILLGEDGENVVSRNLPLAFIASGKYWVNNHAHIISPKENIDIYYLCEFLESLEYADIASGSAQPKITQASLNKIQIAIPSKPEQKKIASILTSIDTNIEQEQTKLTQTKNLKKSLMSDLLTGRVRVKV